MRKLLFALVLTTLVSGCGMLYRQPIYQGNLVEKSNVEQLQVGMDKRQVMALLGTPSVQDPFHAQRWDYSATERNKRRGTTEGKTLTLHFENDTLVRWEGDYFPEQDLELARSANRQFGPNLPKEDKGKGRR